jgi:hypothetical protein
VQETPACEIEYVRPPTEIEPVRVVAAVLAVRLNRTVPFPTPGVPELIVIQPPLGTALQVQSIPADTLKLPLLAAAEKEPDGGVSV